MAEPYVGQVSPFAFPYAPVNWAFCNGGTVPMNQYYALFALIGTTFGGNGSSTIGLPNLNGAAPCGSGQGPGLTSRTLGQSFGAAGVTLDITTLTLHTHDANVVDLGRDDPGSTPTAAAGLASTAGVSAYAIGAPSVLMAPGAITSIGGGGAHNNRQPYVAVNYCIALMGLFPEFP